MPAKSNPPTSTGGRMTMSGASFKPVTMLVFPGVLDGIRNGALTASRTAPRDDHLIVQHGEFRPARRARYHNPFRSVAAPCAEANPDPRSGEKGQEREHHPHERASRQQTWNRERCRDEHSQQRKDHRERGPFAFTESTAVIRDSLFVLRLSHGHPVARRVRNVVFCCERLNRKQLWGGR